MHSSNKPHSPKRLASLSLLIILTLAALPLTGGRAQLVADLRPGQSSPAGKISADREVTSTGHATATTGTDAARSLPALKGSDTVSVDGAGVGITGGYYRQAVNPAPMLSGIVMSDRTVRSGGIVMSDGRLPSDGHVMSAGIVMSDNAFSPDSVLVGGDATEHVR